MAQTSLPKTHKALILTARGQPLEVKDSPTPQPAPGNAIIRIISALVVSYSGEVYSGKRYYPFPTPLVPGYSAVGRVAAVGADSTLLKQDQLVMIESTIRSRDNSDDVFLLGVISGFSDGSRKLMDGEWRNGTWAEYAKVPLENCYPLNEDRLLNELKYSVEVLNQLGQLFVPYGGLSDINVKPGETVIVTPATGPFGSAGVRVAVAMGARVIAMGRNEAALDTLRSSLPKGRVITIPLTEDAEQIGKELAKHAPIDAYFDISPPVAQGTHYLKTCIMSLRRGGRVSLMGGFMEDVALPHHKIMHSSIELKGTWMSTREQNLRLIRMVEQGILSLGAEQGWSLKGKFALEDWEQAFACARDNAGPGEFVVMSP